MILYWFYITVIINYTLYSAPVPHMLICHQPFNPQRPARLDLLVKVDVAGFKKDGASGKGLSCLGEVAFYSSFVNMMKTKKIWC